MIEQDFNNRQIMFSLSLVYLSIIFCSNLSLFLSTHPSSSPPNLYSCFNGVVMMSGYLVWQWPPPFMKFWWFLQSCPLFHCVISRIREGPHFLPLRWHSGNLYLTLNLVLGEQTFPMHYLTSLANMGFNWKVSPSWSPSLRCPFG